MSNLPRNAVKRLKQEAVVFPAYEDIFVYDIFGNIVRLVDLQKKRQFLPSEIVVLSKKTHIKLGVLTLNFIDKNLTISKVFKSSEKSVYKHVLTLAQAFVCRHIYPELNKQSYSNP